MNNKRKKRDLTTYEVQEERYRKRLELIKLRKGLSSDDLRRLANASPRKLKRANHS